MSNVIGNITIVKVLIIIIIFRILSLKSSIDAYNYTGCRSKSQNSLESHDTSREKDESNGQ